MYEPRNLMLAAEIEYRTERARNSFPRTSRTSPRSGRRRPASLNSGSWGTWRFQKLAG
jgi:hypothetical protein